MSLERCEGSTQANSQAVDFVPNPESCQVHFVTISGTRSVSKKAVTCSLLDAFNSFNQSNSFACSNGREKLPGVDSGERLIAMACNDSTRGNGFKLE